MNTINQPRDQGWHAKLTAFSVFVEMTIISPRIQQCVDEGMFNVWVFGSLLQDIPGSISRARSCHTCVEGTHVQSTGLCMECHCGGFHSQFNRPFFQRTNEVVYVLFPSRFLGKRMFESFRRRIKARKINSEQTLRKRAAVKQAVVYPGYQIASNDEFWFADAALTITDRKCILVMLYLSMTSCPGRKEGPRW